MFYIRQRENDSICFEQRIASFHCYANEVLLFPLRIIIYLLISFGGKQFEVIKKKDFFKKDKNKKWWEKK